MKVPVDTLSLVGTYINQSYRYMSVKSPAFTQRASSTLTSFVKTLRASESLIGSLVNDMSPLPPGMLEASNTRGGWGHSSMHLEGPAMLTKSPPEVLTRLKILTPS